MSISDLLGAAGGLVERGEEALDAASVAGEVGEAQGAIGNVSDLGSLGAAVSESIEAVGSVAENIDNDLVQDGIIEKLPEGLQGMAGDMFETLNDLGITDLVADAAQGLNDAVRSLGEGASIGDVADVAASRTPESSPNVLPPSQGTQIS